jgi:predicted DNA-binding mobile mystery protein A
MRKGQKAAQARRELDKKFRSVNLESIRARPRSGWIRSVRGALGMTQDILAERLGVSGAAVTKLERAEVHGGVTIGKLDEVARALDCSLVYAFVPNTSLDQFVMTHARAIAARDLGYVSQTMKLEVQDIEEESRQEAIDRYALELVDSSTLWRAISKMNRRNDDKHSE